MGAAIAILPVVAGGKPPAIKGGVRAASKNKGLVDRWLKARPNLNYGIATGAPSKFFAVDIDGPLGRATLAALERKHGPLPATVTVKTPHGAHYYFETPTYAIPNSAGRLGDGLDIRGDGGYVIGPGSQTPGGVYRFVLGRGPEVVKIAPAPDWLLSLIGSKPAVAEGTPGFDWQIIRR
jgi:hypothetical protein